MKYPSINREQVSFESDTEVCNVGYCEMEIDSRPVRIEVWSSFDILNATIFISTIDLEKYNDKELKQFLVQNKIIEIIKDKIFITKIEDIDDNSFYSINVPLEGKDVIINKCLVKLKNYEY